MIIYKSVKISLSSTFTRSGWYLATPLKEKKEI